MIKYVLQENMIRTQNNEEFYLKYRETPLIDINPEKNSIFNLWKKSRKLNKEKAKTEPIKKDKIFMIEKSIQTEYREELTQTDPYSPPKVVTEETDPELLKIEHFKWGRELPPSIDELLYIEELREKAAFEGALPPLSDEACFFLRRKLMQNQEIKDWEKRENEIKRQQANKITLLQNILIEREKEIEKSTKNKLEKLKSIKNKQKNYIVAKIQKRKKKILRKLIRIQKNFVEMKNKKNIISEYNNYSSKIYANITREGISLENLSEKFKKNPLALTKYELYRELITSLKPKTTEVHISLDELLKKSERKYFKLEKEHLQQLKKAQQDLWGEKDNRKTNISTDIYDLNLQDVVLRPDTPYSEKRKELLNYPHKTINLDKSKMPEAEKKIENKEKKHRAAMLLQKLLKGRAIQNSLFDGKEKRLALIEELLIVANIDQLKKEDEDEKIERIIKKNIKKGILKQIKGKIVTDITDNLSCELIRFIEEQKVREFVKMAEEERRNREAVETGRRQAELIVKNREQKLYSEILEVHKDCVEDFIDDVLDYSSNFLTKKIAMNQTKIKEKTFNQYLEKNNDNFDVLIKDFMYLFLIPNVDKQKLRKKIKIEEKKFSEIIKENTNKKFR